MIQRRYSNYLVMDGAKEVLGRAQRGEFNEVVEKHNGQRWDIHVNEYQDKLIEIARVLAGTSEGEITQQDKPSRNRVMWADEEDAMESMDPGEVLQNYVVNNLDVDDRTHGATEDEPAEEMTCGDDPTPSESKQRLKGRKQSRGTCLMRDA